MKLFLLVTLFMFGCKTKSLAGDNNCGFSKNIYGIRVKWDKLPIVVKIDSSVPKEYISSIEFAVSKWNSTGMNLFKLSDSLPANVVVYNVTDWKRLPQEQGVTRLFWSDATINKATVSINSQNFEFFFGKKGEGVSLDSLMLHEFGHVIGLVHYEGSIMNPFLAKNTYVGEVSQHEINSINCVYGKETQ